MKIEFNPLILALSKIKNLGKKRIFKLILKIKYLDEYSLSQLFDEFELYKKITKADFEHIYEDSISELEKMKSSNIKIYNIFENDEVGLFKDKLFSQNKVLTDEFPNQLFLINKSDLIIDSFKNIFTIIGTRNNSADAKDITEKIVTFLCEKQSIIISGLAKGIDTIAHQKVVDLGGATIAILANGLDTIYPSENRELAKKILDKGILLTEYTFGLKAEKFRLIERDRIQAMLANDIVLIESDIKGGSMHAMKWAKKLNKRIWCFDMNASGNKEILNNYDNVIKFSNMEEFINKFNINS